MNVCHSNKQGSHLYIKKIHLIFNYLFVTYGPSFSESSWASERIYAAAGAPAIKELRKKPEILLEISHVISNNLRIILVLLSRDWQNS